MITSRRSARRSFPGRSNSAATTNSNRGNENQDPFGDHHRPDGCVRPWVPQTVTLSLLSRPPLAFADGIGLSESLHGVTNASWSAADRLAGGARIVDLERQYNADCGIGFAPIGGSPALSEIPYTPHSSSREDAS